MFNPFVEAYISLGAAFTPSKHQQSLQRDWRICPNSFAAETISVLVEQRPSGGFLQELQKAGFVVPEFVPKEEPREVPFEQNLQKRKLGSVRPWGWGPDSLKLLAPLLPNITSDRHTPEQFFNPNLARLYSKTWSAEFLKAVLENLAQEATPGGTPSNSLSPFTWLCTPDEVGKAVRDPQQAVDHIQAIRSRGHWDIVD